MPRLLILDLETFCSRGANRLYCQSSSPLQWKKSDCPWSTSATNSAHGNSHNSLACTLWDIKYPVLLHCEPKHFLRYLKHASVSWLWPLTWIYHLFALDDNFCTCSAFDYYHLEPKSPWPSWLHLDSHTNLEGLRPARCHYLLWVLSQEAHWCYLHSGMPSFTSSH